LGDFAAVFVEWLVHGVSFFSFIATGRTLLIMIISKQMKKGLDF
jgi:hypothetical protein